MLSEANLSYKFWAKVLATVTYMVTCRNTSYSSLLCKIMRPYHIGREENMGKSREFD